MELLYIWIGEYKNLKNIGFNFTNEYKIEVKQDESNGEAKEIKIEKNQEKSSYNIFGDGSLKSINAIIGENGTGKTTILDFIKEFINGNFETEKMNYPERNSKYIIVYNDEKESKIYCRAKEIDVIKNGSFVIQYENYYENSSRIQYRLDLNAKKEIESKIPEFWKSTDVIYHSNIFDYKTEKYSDDKKNIYNISTNYYLDNYKKNYDYIKRTREEPVNKIEGILKKLKIKSEKTKEEINEIENEFISLKNRLLEGDTEARVVSYYKIEEMRRQINFFNDVKDGSKFNFNIKEEINIPQNIIFTIQNPFMDAKKLSSEMPKTRNVLSSETFVKGNEKVKNKKNSLRIRFIMNIYNVFSLELEDFKYIEKAENDEINIELFDGKTFLEKYIINNLKKDSKYKEKIKKLYEYFNEGIEKVEEKNIGINNEMIISLRQKEIIDNFLQITTELPIESKEDNKLINYEWDRDMSTGEKEILSFLSRVYSCKDKIKTENILILLDEPDIHLHPEWQRKLINILIEFINYCFKDREVRIILSSHSLFVISDLPRENVILLKKEVGNTKVETKEMSSTFASNIHTLFKNSFFVKSTFGEFAKSKIKEVIEYIETGKIEDNKEMIDYIISIVGEPLIKTKLENMRYEKMSKEEKIKKLQAEIDRLEKGEGN